MDLNDCWPLFGIKITSPRLELRLAKDDQLVQLIDVARQGIHPPERMPFANAWTDTPSPEFERSFMQWHWRGRAEWTRDNWRLGLVVFLDGSPIGAQDVSGRMFSAIKTVESGSWLGAKYQGQGFGKEMRAAMLHFAFDGLGAEIARSSAWGDNAQSIGVSDSLGYAQDGTDRAAPRGEMVEVVRFKLTREDWLAQHKIPVQVEGLDDFIDMFGAGIL